MPDLLRDHAENAPKSSQARGSARIAMQPIPAWSTAAPLPTASEQEKPLRASARRFEMSVSGLTRRGEWPQQF
jgi:hypothetical protein